MLSAEIIVIALGTVASHPFSTQVAVLAGIALLMTVGVYGIVAAIVKMDDVGLYCLQQGNAPLQVIGKWLLLAAPKLMRALTVIGTAAMFLVGGGILAHGIPLLHHGIEQFAANFGVLGGIVALVLDMATGIVGGGLALLATGLATRLVKTLKGTKS